MIFLSMAATALARYYPPLLRLRAPASCRLMAAIAACAVNMTPLHAAEIKFGQGGAVLEGKIETGDYEKLRDLIKVYLYDSIYLASPGGNVAEAIKIGRLVRALNLQTVIPGQIDSEFRSRVSGDVLKKVAARQNIKNIEANYMCASACFFIFVAGVHRTKDFSLDEPVLGIHRPFLTDNDLRTLSASQAIGSANDLRTVVENYLKEMSVPAKYADLMFSVPKDQIRWIGRADFESDLEGFIPPLKDWIDARCDKRTNAEKAMWELFKDKRPAEMTAAEKSVSDLLEKKLSEQYRCEYAALGELSHQAHLNMFPEPK